jgi:hypothetical protein
MEYLENAVSLGPIVFMVLSAIATVTPTPVDNQALVWLRKILSVLTLSVGHARDAGAVIAEQNKNGK